MAGVLCWLFAAAGADAAEPLPAALGYLARETQAWPRKNSCFSCHHSGDAARALFLARRAGRPVDAAALRETLKWLEQPQRWATELADTEFKDAELAQLQFAAALAEAQAADLVDAKQPLEAAADLLAAHQKPDGRFSVDKSGLGGGPVTYGDALATAMARRVLAAAGSQRHAERIEQTDRWLRAARPKSPAEAAAVVLGVEGADDHQAAEQRRRFAVLAAESQGASGGWGQFAARAAEPFDTALVLLALAKVSNAEGVSAMIARGRTWLLAQQEPEGNWPATTRPAGAESYAHRVSTTAWVVQALLATEPR
jgi:hypothetical protein